MTVPDAFDIVIIGGGTAGCLLANRLSADRSLRVALVEAGPRDRNPWIRIPAGYLRLIGNPAADWCYCTEAEPRLNGRSLPYARGRVLGGSSAINGMIYMRGHRANYDAWIAAGAEGWGWDDMLPWFLRHEDFHSPAPFHATGGELPVARQRLSWPVLDAAVAGLGELGLPLVEDFNTGDNTGAGRFHVTQSGGLRASAATAFLAPVRWRTNLAVLTGAHATRILFDGRRAIGVAVQRADGEHRLIARAEVILAAGAFGTPHLLELSGVGDAALLQTQGIAPLHDLRGVGENLIDHLQIRPVFRVTGAQTLNTRSRGLAGKIGIALAYALRRSGPLSMAPSQAGGFLRSDPERPAPDLHVNLQPLSLDAFGSPLHAFDAITVSVSNVQPDSRGKTHLRGPDWHRAPAIAPGYLSGGSDMARAVAAVRLARALMATGPMQCFSPQEYRPGDAIQSDDEVLSASAQLAGTLFHACGTARMGRGPDAVVDPALRVVGLERLRVIDASVIPAPLSGGLAAPILAIAERGAALVLADLAKRHRAASVAPQMGSNPRQNKASVSSRNAERLPNSPGNRAGTGPYPERHLGSVPIYS